MVGDICGGRHMWQASLVAGDVSGGRHIVVGDVSGGRR